MNIDTTKIRNTEIREILERYNHYDHMLYDDWKTFKNYLTELQDADKIYNRNTFIKHNIPKSYLQLLNVELAQMEYINKFKIYRNTIVTIHEMNGVLRGLWDKECSGYSNNAFYDFQTLVKYVNAYWQIETPYKPANKIAYGWKFSMEKADTKNGYYSKSWKLYMWGCIKNYLKRNGIDFNKEESLKVRQIVGLAEIYDTTI